jgi:hypothetical protein
MEHGFVYGVQKGGPGSCLQHATTASAGEESKGSSILMLYD